MEQTDLTYRLEIVPRWVSKVPTTERCPDCLGTGKKSGLFNMYGDDDEESLKCSRCHGYGNVAIPMPPLPAIDPAFIWHMQNAYKDFWTRQPEIQAAYALKKAHEDSINSAGL